VLLKTAEGMAGSKQAGKEEALLGWGGPIVLNGETHVRCGSQSKDVSALFLY
jgi:hypothetical protein